MWPTPDLHSQPWDYTTADPERQRRAQTKRTIGLPAVAQMWATPRASAQRTSRQSLTRDGHWSAPALEQMAELSLGSLPREYATEDELTPQAAAIYWATPNARDWRSGEASEVTRQRNARPLNEQVVTLACSRPGPPTPMAGDPSSPSIPTSPRPSLNPRFVEWLQGLAPGWLSYAPLATSAYRWWQRSHSARLAAVCGSDEI